MIEIPEITDEPDSTDILSKDPIGEKSNSENEETALTVTQRNMVEADNLPELHADKAVSLSSELPQDEANTHPISMETLSDVPVTITAVLGKKRVDIATLLAMHKDTIIDIDRKIGEPIDLYVNDTLIAKGELVMVEGSLGISMTEIIQDNPVLQSLPDALTAT